MSKHIRKTSPKRVRQIINQPPSKPAAVAHVSSDHTENEAIHRLIAPQSIDMETEWMGFKYRKPVSKYRRFAAEREGRMTQFLLEVGDQSTVDSIYKSCFNNAKIAADANEQRRIYSEYREKYPAWAAESLWMRKLQDGGFDPGPYPQPASDRDTAPKVGTKDAKIAGVTVRAAQRSKSFEKNRFVHSEDFRSVDLDGKKLTLTSRQAQVIQILFDEHENGTAEIGQAFILDRLGSGSRLRDVFKSNIGAWKKLISSGSRKGTFRLNFS
jgi:hypothetical protein